MTVGIPTDKLACDQAVGQLARQIQQWSSRVPDFKAWLDTIPDADLQAPLPFGYTPQEVALLRSATNDMNTLARIYHGLIDHTPASDLSAFAKQLAGIPAYPTLP